MSLLLQQIVEEGVEVLVEILHDVTAEDDCVVVGKIELSHLLLIIILQDDAERLEDAEIIDGFRHLLQYAADHQCDGVKECLIRVIDPLINNDARDLVVIIIISEEITIIRIGTEMDIREHCRFLERREFLGYLIKKSFELLVCLLGSFHLNHRLIRLILLFAKIVKIIFSENVYVIFFRENAIFSCLFLIILLSLHCKTTRNLSLK